MQRQSTTIPLPACTVLGALTEVGADVSQHHPQMHACATSSASVPGKMTLMVWTVWVVSEGVAVSVLSRLQYLYAWPFRPLVAPLTMAAPLIVLLDEREVLASGRLHVGGSATDGECVV